jgi:hypothetical protein
MHVYLAAESDRLTMYTQGQTAEAEPAAPGCRVLVDDLFG